MFDPERDEDSGVRPFYFRLAIVVLFTASSCAALYPSVVGVDADGGSHMCVAMRDGWTAAAPCQASRGVLLWTLAGLALNGLVFAGLLVRNRARRARNGRPEGRPKIANLGV